MLNPRQKATIIGVLMDLGADRRGVDMGPSAIRVAGLNQRLTALGYYVVDGGNINVRNPEMLRESNGKAKSSMPGKTDPGSAVCRTPLQAVSAHSTAAR